MRIVERPMESTKDEGQSEMIQHDLSDTTVIFDDLMVVDASTEAEKPPSPDYV